MDAATRRQLERVAGVIVERRSTVRAVLAAGHRPDVVAVGSSADGTDPDADFARAMAAARGSLDTAQRSRGSLVSALTGRPTARRVMAALEVLGAAEPYVGTAFDATGVAWGGSTTVYFQMHPAARMCREAREVLGDRICAALDQAVEQQSLDAAGGRAGATSPPAVVSSPVEKPAVALGRKPPTRAGRPR